jgi:Flp pilus assembly protein CpaB
MNRRTLILLLLVIVLGGGAAVLVIMNQQAAEGPKPEDASPAAPGTVPTQVFPTQIPIFYTRVLVAAQEIPRGMVIPEDGVVVREWPVESAPAYGLADPGDAIGFIARTDIAREMPILSTQLVDNLSQIARRGSDAAAVIPPGLVAVAVPIDRLTNVAHAPKSGDYVDVILSFLFVDVDEEFQSRLPNRLTLTTVRQDGTLEFLTGLEGRVEPSGDFQFPVIVGPSETQRPRLVTQRTIQAAFVLHVGTFPPDGDFLGRRPTPTPLPPPPDGAPTPTPPPAQPTPTPLPLDMITLAVEPQDAVVLVWAIESRLPITLALRSANDLTRTPTTAVTLEYMINTYNVPQPPRLPYALEPAIRSIRRLVIGNEVTFLTTAEGGQ